MNLLEGPFLQVSLPLPIVPASASRLGPPRIEGEFLRGNRTLPRKPDKSSWGVPNQNREVVASFRSCFDLPDECRKDSRLLLTNNPLANREIGLIGVLPHCVFDD